MMRSILNARSIEKARFIESNQTISVMIVKAKISVLLMLCLFLSACDANEKNLNNSANAGNAVSPSNKPAPAEVAGEKLVLFGVGESATHKCGGREVEIDREATASRYILKGDCKKLTVDGVSNEIEVERVGEITIDGTSNKVIYAAGLDDKKPKIKKRGTNTSVESKQEADKRKKAVEEAEKKAAKPSEMKR